MSARFVRFPTFADPTTFVFVLVVAVVAAGAAALGCSGTGSGGDLVGGSSGASGASGAAPGSNGASSGRDGTSQGSSSSDGAALFDAPSGTATPGSIYGLWGGPASDMGVSFDMRMQIGPSSVRFATQCEENGVRPPVAAVTARARVTSEEIAVLESKEHVTSQSGVTCKSTLRVYTVRRCEVRSGFERECFTLDGTQLVIYGKSSLEKIALTKISD